MFESALTKNTKLENKIFIKPIWKPKDAQKGLILAFENILNRQMIFII